MSPTKVLHSQFDPAAVTFKPIVSGAMGVKIPIVYGADDQQLSLQTPPMRVPFAWGTSKYATSTFSLAFAKDSSDLERKLTELDAMIEQVCLDNITKLFPTLPNAAQKATYLPLVKRTDEKYTSLLRTKVPVRNEQTETRVYDRKKQPLDMDHLKAKAVVRAVLRFSYIWATNKMYGVSPYLDLVVVEKEGGADDDSLLTDADHPLQQQVEQEEE